MANPHPFATVNHICLALGIPYVSRLHGELVLTAKRGIPVVILDRTWITQAVFEHDRVSLAVEALGIEEVSLRSERRTGPRDFKRQQELQELDAEIANPDRYAGARYQLAEDCLRAALLARGLEKPRTEVEGYFSRADRIAAEIGNRPQRLRVAYNYAWTTIFWYNDHALLNSMYPIVESFAIESDQAGDVELPQNLWQVLTANVWRGVLTRDEAKLDSRREALATQLDRLSADSSRPNNALQARTSRLLLDLYVAMEKHDVIAFDGIWSRCANIIDDAEHLGDYPFERFVKLIRLFGELGIESASFDTLFEKALSALEKRRSEVAGGELLVEKGFQKLKAKKIYEAVKLFGRALERVIKHESRDDVINVLMGLCIAYEKAGLLWASRSCALSAVERSLISFREDGNFNPLVIPCLKKLAWLELQLGRLPRIIEAYELLGALLAHFNFDVERQSALRHERDMLDAIIGIL
jgi:hypothetical protein